MFSENDFMDSSSFDFSYDDVYNDTETELSMNGPYDYDDEDSYSESDSLDDDFVDDEETESFDDMLEEDADALEESFDDIEPEDGYGTVKYYSYDDLMEEGDENDLWNIEGDDE